MKTLVKCHLCLITLLAAALFMVSTATSDDQTDVSTQEIQQTTQKPTIMILGSTTLGESGSGCIQHKNG